MPYPAKPKQPDVNQEYRGLVPAAGVARVATLPQTIGGAPKLVVDPTVRTPVLAPDPSIGSLSGGTSVMQPLAQPKSPQVDYNIPVPWAYGTGGPERTNDPRRNLYNSTTLAHAADISPHPYKATEILQDYPQAVSSFRDMLTTKREQVPAGQIAKSPFWQKFDTMGQAFVAELIGDVMGILTSADRAGTGGGSLPMSQTQQQWVQNHPLARWFEWKV